MKNMYTYYSRLKKLTKFNEYLKTKDILTSSIFDIFEAINNCISEDKEFIDFCSKNKKYNDRYYECCDLLHNKFGLNFLSEARGGLKYGVFFQLELVYNDLTIQAIPVKLSFSEKAFKNKTFLKYDKERFNKMRCHIRYFDEPLYKEYIETYVISNNKPKFGYSENQQPYKVGEFKEFLNDIQLVYGN